MANPYFLNKLLRHNTRTHLKNVAQGSEQGAGGAKKRSIHGSVCEHVEPTRNASMGT
jgi:hypothetical protein